MTHELTHMLSYPVPKGRLQFALLKLIIMIMVILFYSHDHDQTFGFLAFLNISLALDIFHTFRGVRYIKLLSMWTCSYHGIICRIWLSNYWILVSPENIRYNCYQFDLRPLCANCQDHQLISQTSSVIILTCANAILIKLLSKYGQRMPSPNMGRGCHAISY